MDVAVNKGAKQQLLLLGSSSSSSRKGLANYWKLSKGHLSVWVAISAMPGYLISATLFDPITCVSIFAGTFLTSSCAQSINQIKEIDRDALMNRTKMRVLPTGILSIDQAKKFAAISGSSGASLLFLGTNSLFPPIIALSTAALYANVYTPMKVTSYYNTHIGAIVGSLPVLIGYAAAAAAAGAAATAAPSAFLLDPSVWILFSLQTLWQFPHFYSLAWLHKEDYTRGGYKMFPMIDQKNGKETAIWCAPYMAGLISIPFIAPWMGATSWMFTLSGSIPNILWTKLGFLPFYQNPSKEKARSFFLHSLWYLVAMYTAFVFHAKTSSDETTEQRSVIYKIKKKMLEYCPHELVAKDWTIPSIFCPNNTTTKT
jgi:heme o synthase